MKSLTLLIVGLAVLAGCTTPHPRAAHEATAEVVLGAGGSSPAEINTGELRVSPVQSLVLGGVVFSAVDVPRATSDPKSLAAPAEVLAGHPITAVVVTQCNLVVVVYLTMPDGRLLRMDKGSHLKAEELVSVADTADRRERVEVSCNGEGEVGHERRDPT